MKEDRERAVALGYAVTKPDILAEVEREEAAAGSYGEHRSPQPRAAPAGPSQGDWLGTEVKSEEGVSPLPGSPPAPHSDPLPAQACGCRGTCEPELRPGNGGSVAPLPALESHGRRPGQPPLECAQCGRALGPKPDLVRHRPARGEEHAGTRGVGLPEPAGLGALGSPRQTAPARKERKELSLPEKVRVLEMLEGPKVSQSELAKRFGVSQPQICRIIKNKERILSEWRRQGQPERKRRRDGGDAALEAALLRWVEGAGPFLQLKARQLAEALGQPGPEPSAEQSPLRVPRHRGKPPTQRADAEQLAASQAMPASGRKRKANFSNDETETLVWNVVRHFSALYGSEALRAHPVRRKQLWTQIQSRVNFLGYTERSIDDLKHKWRDLRLDVKKKITSKKHLPVNRAGGPLHKPRLTPLEKMVASTFLQASHDSEPEIILDPDLFFPGASKQPFMHLQPGVSHPSIYIDTNGQPSALPDVEGSAVPRLAVQSPDPSVICEYSRGEGQSSSAESGPELRTPDASAMSPSLRNESLVSYASMSEEEERDGREVERGGHGGAGGMQPGPEAPAAAEEDMKASRQAMLIRRCSSQGSVTSLPEDPLNAADAHSDWGHEAVSDLPALARGLDSSQPEEPAGGGPDAGALPRVLMGPSWEKGPPEEEPPARSPPHGAMTEESLPSSASPPGDAPAGPGVPRGLGCSRLRDERRESWRTNIHHLLELEEQWDQLYHQELAMWQEERATQREERARDRELQFRLLGVLTDIRDELRYLRQERAGARQSQAQGPAPPPAPCPAPGPLLEQPKAEPAFPEPQPGPAAWADAAVPARSPFGNRGRGRRRGRPRGSASRHRRLFLANS
ncbi:uncharacterized protein LOC133625575 [Colius striatus]|uniref:uncharacterized protein LOC133625575 n=1 Tax=Colius striatus TaxID=57412 RepID=UPI002B1D716C|nr:uncharacterized protein LOC133625575 [Colius striatus]